MPPSKMPLLQPEDRPDIPSLEADLAYFEARLSFLTTAGNSLYQRAQQRAYHALEQAASSTLGDLKRQQKKNG